jgi:hypothetical protein
MNSFFIDCSLFKLIEEHPNACKVTTGNDFYQIAVEIV